MQSSESTTTPSTPIAREGGLAIDDEQAQSFLQKHFYPAVSDLGEIGAGAWSRCFGFRCGDEELVVRFGRYLDDFQKDQQAHQYAAPGLPIPEVRAIGRAFDGYFAISTRCYGEPLEGLNPVRWQATLPSLVAVLEGLRTADLSTTSGFGGWGTDGVASHTKWSAHLLSTLVDTPERRTHGWRARLATVREDEATFVWGCGRLEQMADVLDQCAPRSLIHADLMNRNVLVDEKGISGVFDWGCACYGDHLYDLAWFEFWAPWHPQLDVPALRSALEDRWRAVGYTPPNLTLRLQACYLHIGLDHLAYNAWLRDWPTLSATAQRMRTLVENV
ncbi:MAG: aminoglycoside phosphotransferase family protein [Caldilineaceae bacterium]|nr:aminoglycoside phosphotransferase family protein [Caldilineaceae bacterium]